MTLDRWIALGACVAGFISAIAALLVIKQSNLQRKLSYKPQIILNNTLFEYTFGDKLNIQEKIIFEKANNTKGSRSDLAVNIGLGAALKVKISWTHDYNELGTILNKYLVALNKKNTVKTSRAGISILNADKKLHAFIVNKNHSENLDYILPYNHKPIPTEIYIPHTFITLTCTAMYYSFHVDELMNESLPELTVRIEYNDIGGERYIDEYNVRVKFHYAQNINEEIKMGGELYFDKKNINGTTKKLEKIRKSYATFARKHNPYIYKKL